MSNKSNAHSDRIADDEDATVELPRPPADFAGFDPYSTVTNRDVPDKPGRTLDDMRQLSQEIKKTRQGSAERQK
jgi:hypothetical protein